MLNETWAIYQSETLTLLKILLINALSIVLGIYKGLNNEQTSVYALFYSRKIIRLYALSSAVFFLPTSDVTLS
jgi:ABC-type microcin C transport system permease subunit YejB